MELFRWILDFIYNLPPLNPMLINRRRNVTRSHKIILEEELGARQGLERWSILVSEVIYLSSLNELGTRDARLRLLRAQLLAITLSLTS